MYAALLGLLEAQCTLRLHILTRRATTLRAINHTISLQPNRTMMIRRLRRRTWGAPHSRHEQCRSDNYRLIERHGVANTYQTATEPLGALIHLPVDRNRIQVTHV